MEKFIVKVCKGLISNSKKNTYRIGYWIPLRDIPARIAQRLDCDKEDARKSLAWDTYKRQWRDMKNAVEESHAIVTAVLVKVDGVQTIALLDF